MRARFITLISDLMVRVTGDGLTLFFSDPLGSAREHWDPVRILDRGGEADVN